ncbi:hypothetical protein QA645_42145 [Bradyrhizobium sp. CIAT3101]|uniref:hypothetical protein n=1 Tax=Bradyrhizobium sp. CIAT3101 TaxID=439387 RepID=UPI0024B1AA1A|nr:hypothetical protein [Bradyrhizobium sp. CIAT3101]WFU80942.1 hypothetical protein QA645_42145 [Bradyrhizobium sp. CIAT3101]
MADFFRVFFLGFLCCGGLFATTPAARSKRSHASGCSSISLPWLGFAMPRQPYLRVVPHPKGAKIDIGTHVLQQRPELQAVIGDCLLSWPFVEAEMAVLLGLLIGAENQAAMAVFQSMRRSQAQREAISEAARYAISPQDQELLSAILNVHKSAEAERNALAHGHFGTSTKLPNDLIWQTTNDYLTFRAQMALTNATWSDETHQSLLASIWVYTLKDLKMIEQDIKHLAHMWFDFLKYLQAHKRNTKKASELYSQLCGRPRIAQELRILRQKNNPSVPPQSPPPVDGEKA